VRPTIARKWLLPAKLAVYPSPENLEKYERIKQEKGDTGPRHTAYAMKVSYRFWSERAKFGILENMRKFI
jgi:ribosomal protein L9